MKSNGTPVYARQHKRGLTLPQQSAIDLLASGKTDTEAAELLKLSRTCITKWRLYDPVFQAGLNRRRAEVWGAGIDRLRSLIPQALDVLGEELAREDNPHRWKVACQVLALVKPAIPHVGAIEPEEILRGIARQRWERLPTRLDSLMTDGRPDFEGYVETTRQDLDARLAEPEPANGDETTKGGTANSCPVDS
jgi:hypothetical protein